MSEMIKRVRQQAKIITKEVYFLNSFVGLLVCLFVCFIFILFPFCFVFLPPTSTVVWWLARWTSDLKVGGSTPSPGHRVVSLDKKLHPTFSLSTHQVYKIGTGDIMLRVTL